MEILILFILTLVNGIFALTEIALVSLKRNRIEQLAKSGNSSAYVVLKLLEQPENFLSSIQVGITLIGVVAGAYGGSALADDVVPLLQQVSWLAPYAESLSIILIVGLITYFTIVIGELIPKSIALRNPERVALVFAPGIRIFSRLAYPLVRLLSISTTAILRLLGIKEAPEDFLTEEELRQLLKSAGKQGVLEREESQMHQNLFVFADQRVKSLITHRTELEWIDLRQPMEAVYEMVRGSVHSKFLVCDANIDNIRGIISAKEFLQFKDEEGFSLEKILRQPMFVPETMYALDLLNTFKKEKQSLAVVVDEYGSVEGILTLHDLLESIVGDLPDLDELEETEFVKRDEDSYLVSGGITVHELNVRLEKEFLAEHTGHYTTLGGFIIYHLNKIPQTGERFIYNGYDFEVVDLDGQRIDKVIITKHPIPAE
ncbi:MAG: hemolysin family protein [Cyclobacteriaceae bacterium]